MQEDNQKTILNPEQAIAMLAEGEEVHAFVNPAPSVLLGADWQRQQVADYIKSASICELAGPGATKMGHGLAVHGERGLVFFATRGHRDENA